MQSVIAELIAAKKAANRRPRYVKGLLQYLHFFARGRETALISSITGPQIEQWFAAHGGTPSAQASNLGRLSALFSFATRRGYASCNPCNQVEHINIDQIAPVILTVKQTTKLLRKCRRVTPELLAYIVLGLFGGVRPEETEHLTWPDLDLVRGRVTINISKVRRRRITDLPANAVEWLKLCDQTQPLVPKKSTLRRRRRSLAELCGLTWHQDLLRHTAASYLLARDKDAGKVAMQLGNSPKILLTHYNQIVSPEDAIKYFDIRPGK